MTYLRNHALRAVLLYHGIRREERCRLKVGDIQSRQGVWPLRLEDKREKIRYIPLAMVAQRLIAAYLDAAKPGDETDGPLLRPVQNKATGTLAKPLHKSSVWDRVRLYTQQIDIAKVQEGLGQADISTTRLSDKRGSREDSPALKVQYA